jgi:hypothetical protein
VADLKKWLTDAYNKYQKPIWLTEFGAPDCKSLGWCGSNAAALTQAQVDAFVPQVVAMLEGLSFVQRYAWFVDHTQAGFELSYVFNDNGSLTQTGIDLRDSPAATLLRNFGATSATLSWSRPGLRRADGRILSASPAPQMGFGIPARPGR